MDWYWPKTQNTLLLILINRLVMSYKTEKPPTPEQLGQFWNHRVHPITGWKMSWSKAIQPYNVDISANERDHHNYYENVAWK